MRVPLPSTAFLALLLPALSNAVSLSDMTPRAQNLPPNCERIYDSQISGCGVPDFTTRSCTDTCVSALEALVAPINAACGGQGVSGQNLIVAFLAGVGPQQICPNMGSGSGSGSGNSQQSSAEESTPTTTPTPTPTPTSTTAPPPSSTTTSPMEDQSSLVLDTRSVSPTQTRTRSPDFSGTTTAQSLEPESSAAPLTTATTTPVASGQSSRTTTAAAEKTSGLSSAEAQQQAADDRSGGGSPFDDEGNLFSGADGLAATSVVVSLGIAVVVCVFLFG